MKISLDWSQSCKSSTWKERPRCSLATWRVCEGFFFEQKNRRQSNETIRFWMTQERRWRTGRSAPSRTKPWRGRTRRIPSTRASRWPSWRTRAGTRPTWNWPSRSAGAVTWAATSPNAAAWTGWKPGPPGAVPFFCSTSFFRFFFFFHSASTRSTKGVQATSNGSSARTCIDFQNENVGGKSEWGSSR